MRKSRIVIVALATALIPHLVGFFFGLFSGLLTSLVTADHELLTQVRVWSIRLLLVLAYAWLGWVQRERLVSHALAALTLGLILSTVLGLALHRFLEWAATKINLPALPAWSPDYSGALVVLLIAALGVAAGLTLRRGSGQRGATA